ncbi:hypothetical protein MYX77_11555, partial [Acidobacteriia bacterium AH_259_A11_L15]|nr:hypothetical protein [Acidobacteriia bacterium AH_259_A11_L15]
KQPVGFHYRIHQSSLLRALGVQPFPQQKNLQGAQQIGLVDAVVEADRLLTEALERAGRLASGQTR